MIKSEIKLLILLLLFSSVFYSCTKNKDEGTKIKSQSESGHKEQLNSAGVKEGGLEFSVQYSSPRRIYRIDKEDLNSDGNKEIIVLSVTKDTAEKYDSYYNFDMIEVFALNMENKSYVKILSDTVDYSTECRFVDLNNNKTEQILISTNSGGNDSLTSVGMFVYDMTSADRIELLKYFDSGAPFVKDIKKDGIKEILISDLFYGVMPQVYAIPFVKYIYRLADNNLSERNSEYKEYYDSEISASKEKYYGLKRKFEMGMQPINLSYPLYREAAEVIVNYYAQGDETGLKKFWDEEKDSLKKNIPESEFLDLNNFILKALPSAKNA
ncbi:MAG TPA: hypothetical protein PKC91_11655 [Ignavibacteria bacterium]|nr:hypothetical protein [Ignavibacteria bacterium]